MRVLSYVCSAGLPATIQLCPWAGFPFPVGPGRGGRVHHHREQVVQDLLAEVQAHFVAPELRAVRQELAERDAEVHVRPCRSSIDAWRFGHQKASGMIVALV